MARQLKTHLLRPDTMPAISMCGIYTENSTTDPEMISCQHCSGFYRTNMEWYSQITNKTIASRGTTGEGDLYTRGDVEAGLRRLGWTPTMIKEVLDNTPLFRNVFLHSETPDPWKQQSMGVRVSPGGLKR